MVKNIAFFVTARMDDEKFTLTAHASAQTGMADDDNPKTVTSSIDLSDTEEGRQIAELMNTALQSVTDALNTKATINGYEALVVEGRRNG